MCEAAPTRRRCASHTRQSLESLDRRRKETATQIAELERTIAEKESTGKSPTPTELKRWQTLQDRMYDLNDTRRTRQREYDATKTGQRELKAALENPNLTSDEKRGLMARYKSGKLLSSYHSAIKAAHAEQDELIGSAA